MKNITVVWDGMLDKYSFGEIEKLNPEAPTPLLNIIKEEYRLGGAGNVAANVASLSGQCDLISVIWDDPNGDILEGLCHRTGINFHKIIDGRPTTVKWRFVETTYDQQLLRADREEKHALQQLQQEQTTNKILELNSGILIVSDYDKWMICSEMIERIKSGTFRILVDSKPKNTPLFKGCYLIKPNFKEFAALTWSDIGNTNEEIEGHGKRLVQEYGSNMVVTRWEKWATLITTDGQVFHLSTEAREVFDVSGAGDTFIAAIASALANGADLVEAVRFGNKASGVVVGRVGTAIVKREDIH